MKARGKLGVSRGLFVPHRGSREAGQRCWLSSFPLQKLLWRNRFPPWCEHTVAAAALRWRHPPVTENGHLVHFKITYKSFFSAYYTLRGNNCSAITCGWKWSSYVCYYMSVTSHVRGQCVHPLHVYLTLWSLWAWVKRVGSLSLATKARVSRTVRWGRRRSSWRTWAMLFFTSCGVLGFPLIRTWPDVISPPSSRHVMMSSKDVLPQPEKRWSCNLKQWWRIEFKWSKTDYKKFEALIRLKM